ncbi:MAG TPA: protein kinase [Alloacidobacterium sp.]|nr:protein kinase [Alloacidobacterium sp.]
MALEAGQRVGDYEVLALLGSGGMGRVYKVRNIISNREEAMKILLPDFASEPDLAARFMSEIRTLAGLEHPNIAQLRTAFQFQNQLVMIMEFVEGTTLEKRASQGPIPLNQALEYSTQVLSALQYAHSHGVTHRDIKPANIMITSHGLVKLMDFGIAKSTNDMQLTRPGTTMGSVYYMSPEQVRGGIVDARSDIYSFGVTLYEMLTGRKPFQADTSYSVLNAQLNEAPTPPVQINPTLSPELNNIVLRAMVKNPDGRFRTADEFRNALKALQENYQPSSVAQQLQDFAPVAAVSASTSAGSNKGHRGLWIGLGAVAAIFALIAATTVLPHIFATHADQQTPAATTVSVPSATSNAAAPDASQTHPVSSATPLQPAPASISANSSRALTSKPVVSHAVSANTSAATAQTSMATPVPVEPSQQEIRQAHDRFMDLNARADAARADVQQIRSQQQAQGLDLRGDIVAAMSRMNNDLSEANHSLSQSDIQSADQYMDRAEKEVATLERFLGR